LQNDGRSYYHKGIFGSGSTEGATSDGRMGVEEERTRRDTKVGRITKARRDDKGNSVDTG